MRCVCWRVSRLAARVPRLVDVALDELLAPRGYTLMRFSAGAVVVYHGYAKLFAGFAPVVAKNILTPLGFPLPVVWAYFLGVLELVGGAALAIGLFTRPVALMFVIELAIVTYWHSGNGYFFTSPGGGWEFPLLLLLQYLGTLLSGNYLKRFNWLESTESRFCRAISLSN
jgi:putative oxidoreductase